MNTTAIIWTRLYIDGTATGPSQGRELGIVSLPASDGYSAEAEVRDQTGRTVAEVRRLAESGREQLRRLDFEGKLSRWVWRDSIREVDEFVTVGSAVIDGREVVL